MRKRFTLLCLSFISFKALCNDHVGKGFSWYNDPYVDYSAPTQPHRDRLVVTTSSPKPEEKKPETYAQKLDAFHLKYKNILARFALDPTLKNVDALMQIENEVTQKADKAADFWQENLLLHENLNYEANHPISQEAIHQYDYVMHKKRREAVMDYSRQGYGLFYVFRRSDIYGKQYSKQIQAFADKYHFKLLGISMDGSKLSTIRDVVPNNGKLNIKITPALILVNPKRPNELKAIAFGVKTTSTIIRNISFIHNGYKTLGY